VTFVAEISRLQIGDVALNVEQAGDGEPLLLLHGFTGSARNWRGLEAFGERFRTIAVDLLGHGASDSPADPARYDMAACVGDLAAVLVQLGIQRANVLGYSLGGRVALHLAAAHPERVGRLVLESASPGLMTEAERRARRADDEALALRLERDGLEAFVDGWERLPLFASQARLPAAVRAGLRAQRLRNNPPGLANSLRGLGTGAQPSLWERLPEIHTPTLLLAGALDEKFAAIARAMAERLPEATLFIVPEAGHTIHLEQPDAFAQRVTEFLLHQ
jgi:2-succinyl-6-hydroxy-2,4-cyclohexadiene-1-carboxylate synthase